MDKNFLVQLTNNLYQLTLLFPKKEPLRYKMRELADDILANCLTPGVKHHGVGPLQNLQESDPCEFDIGRTSGILDDLEVLDGFFELSKAQNWVNPEEILKLQQDYSKLKEELKTKINSEKTLTLPLQEKKETKSDFIILPPAQVPSINERQEKILAILREKGRAQVWEIKKIFPETSKRTLRRDFEHLLKQGIIERIGERNDTFYKLKTASKTKF